MSSALGRFTGTVYKHSVKFVLRNSSTMKSFSVVVVSGPSGSGKSTLLQRLLKEHRDCFAFSVSHTTRKPRAGETHGKDYHFVARTEMEKAIADDEFLEYADFSGNLYGTSKKAVSDISASGKICILDVEIKGVQSVKMARMDALYVFIRTPDMQILEERLRKRGTETDESLELRLKTAEEALEYASKPGSYDVIIENRDVEKAYGELKAALLRDINEVRKRSMEISNGQ